MKRWIFPAAWLALSLCAGLAPAAEVYRWTDAAGEVHYADRPGSGGEMVEIKTADAGDESAAADAGPEEPEDPDAVRTENCDKASKRLADYEGASQLVGEDEYGRQHEIVGEERVELILRARKDVEEFCGEATASAPSEPAPAKSEPAAEEAPPQPDAAPAEPAPTEEPAAAAITEEGGLSSY